MTPGLFVVLAAGTYLTIDRWDFGHLFVTVGLAIIAVLLVLGVAFFDRQEARLIELSERDVAGAGSGEVELSEEYWQVSKRFASVGLLASVLVLAALFFMTVKP